MKYQFTIAKVCINKNTSSIAGRGIFESLIRADIPYSEIGE